MHIRLLRFSRMFMTSLARLRPNSILTYFFRWYNDVPWCVYNLANVKVKVKRYASINMPIVICRTINHLSFEIKCKC